MITGCNINTYFKIIRQKSALCPTLIEGIFERYILYLCLEPFYRLLAMLIDWKT